jgi:tetratricopeptide (TPR) repeat protein
MALLTAMGVLVGGGESLAAQSQADAFLEQGNLSLTKQDYDEAIRCYQKALELKPDYAEAWNNMGIAYGSRGNLEEAMRCYKRALEVKPDLNEAWYNMAFTCALLGHAEAALENLRKAIELHPECRQKARADKDFDSVRSNPEFKALVGGGK